MPVDPKKNKPKPAKKVIKGQRGGYRKGSGRKRSPDGKRRYIAAISIHPTLYEYAAILGRSEPDGAPHPDLGKPAQSSGKRPAKKNASHGVEIALQFHKDHAHEFPSPAGPA